jgi:exosortase
MTPASSGNPPLIGELSSDPHPTPPPGQPQSGPSKSTFSWFLIGWVGVLLIVCYAPVLVALVTQWYRDEDMGHGFFVPLLAGYIAWQERDRLKNIEVKPNWWGFVVMAWAAFQLYIATLGAELFLTRTSLVISIIGAVWLLGGNQVLKAFSFPLFLLFFMVPIPAVIYNQITFPLQLLASRIAEGVVSISGIPVIREGNVLELSSQRLNVVEACSGIRSLLTLTFLSLVYGYFVEKRIWIRVALFASTIPIAIAANAGRVTITCFISEIDKDLVEGLFHEAQGWVIFMLAFAMLAVVHRVLQKIAEIMERKNGTEEKGNGNIHAESASA